MKHLSLDKEERKEGRRVGGGREGRKKERWKVEIFY